MNFNSFTKSLLAGSVLIIAADASMAQQRGNRMPAEAMQNIHSLFDSHDAFTRELKITKKGYVAKTESDDPKMAAILKAHVKQMGERLEAGLMVRRWDPAFEEYVAYYDQMEHSFKETPKGIKAVVKGKNPEATKVAQNHAKVIVDFVQHGWTAHDRSHPAALQATETDAPAATGKGGGACCAQGAEGQSGEAPACCQRNDSATAKGGKGPGWQAGQKNK